MSLSRLRLAVPVFALAWGAVSACGGGSPPTSVVPDASTGGTPGAGPGASPGGPGGNPGGSDAGHNLDKLTVRGKVGASGIDVTAHCGAKPDVRAQSDVNGNYGITVDVAGCNPLVLEFARESFLPNLRVIALPPPATPLVLDVPMVQLQRFECDSQVCQTQERRFWVPRADVGSIRRGWAASYAGKEATDLLAGEMRDADKRPITLFGFTYLDMFDGAGTPMSTFPTPLPFVIPLESEAERQNLGDVLRNTTDTVEMHWYRLDKPSGRWEQSQDYAALYFEWPCKDPQDVPARARLGTVAVQKGSDTVLYSRALQSDLASIRINNMKVNCKINDPQSTPTEISNFAIVGKHYGSGWHAWGMSAPKRSCAVLEVKDGCGAPVPGATLLSRGRFAPVRAENFTTALGTACIDSPRSEPICGDAGADAGLGPNPDACDYNYNFLGGELFWLNIEVTHPSLAPQRTFENVEMPRVEGDCTRPSTCVRLEHAFTDCLNKPE